MTLLVHVLWLIGLAAVIANGVGIAVWMVSGRPQLSAIAATVTLIDMIRISLLVTGGIGGIVALVVAYRKQGLGERNEDREIEAANRADRADRREAVKLFSERFSSAAQQIGSDIPMVSLAGVYAMGTLADDWDHGRQMCVDVICASIGRSWGEEKDAPKLKIEGKRVREAASRLIIDHLRAGSKVRWEGVRLDFSGSEISEMRFNNCRIKNCELIFKEVKLGEDALSFWNTTFDNSSLDISRNTIKRNQIDLSDSQFENSTLLAEGCSFTGPMTEFGECTFVDSVARFTRSLFSSGNSVLTDSYFDGCHIDFADVIFRDDSAIFKGCEFREGSSTLVIYKPGALKGLVEIKPAYIEAGCLTISIREKSDINQLDIHDGWVWEEDNHKIKTITWNEEIGTRRW
jgi:uncharacterized protein YjbI with pentapeptide repeats